MSALEGAPLALALTLVAYAAAIWVRRRTGLALVHPALTAAALVFVALSLLRWSVGEYESRTEWLTFLLGPATVAMAVPVYRHRALVLAQWPALVGGIVTGCLLGVTSSVAVAVLLGLGRDLVLSVAPKSVTTPIALGISERLGGIPSLTVAMVMATGLLGAACGPQVLNALRVRNRLARGLALGMAAQAVGAERALQSGEVEGAAATLAMVLNALFSALLVPPVVNLLMLLDRRLRLPGL